MNFLTNLKKMFNNLFCLQVSAMSLLSLTNILNIFNNYHMQT